MPLLTHRFGAPTTKDFQGLETINLSLVGFRLKKNRTTSICTNDTWTIVTKPHKVTRLYRKRTSWNVECVRNITRHSINWRGRIQLVVKSLFGEYIFREPGSPSCTRYKFNTFKDLISGAIPFGFLTKRLGQQQPVPVAYFHPFQWNRQWFQYHVLWHKRQSWFMWTNCI